MSNKVEMARQFLNAIARANYGDKAGFGPMIRQGEGAAILGLAGWYLRPLWVSSDLVFAECRINDRARWVGCPNPPDAYLIRHKGRAYRFQDYGRSLRFAAIRAWKDANP